MKNSLKKKKIKITNKLYTFYKNSTQIHYFFFFTIIDENVIISKMEEKKYFVFLGVCNKPFTAYEFYISIKLI